MGSTVFQTYPSSMLRGNLFGSFCVILLTIHTTNKQVNITSLVELIKHNATEYFNTWTQKRRKKSTQLWHVGLIKEMKTFLIDMHYIIILKKEMLCNMRPMYVCIYEVFTGNRSRHHRSQVCSGIVGSVRLCLSHRLPLTSQRPGSWWEKTSTPVWWSRSEMRRNRRQSKREPMLLFTMRSEYICLNHLRLSVAVSR